MTKKKKYKRYSPEFKHEALKQASAEGVGWQSASSVNPFPCIRYIAPKASFVRDR